VFIVPLLFANGGLFYLTVFLLSSIATFSHILNMTIAGTVMSGVLWVSC